jgi:hypothetical protein
MKIIAMLPAIAVGVTAVQGHAFALAGNNTASLNGLRTPPVTQRVLAGNNTASLNGLRAPSTGENVLVSPNRRSLNLVRNDGASASPQSTFNSEVDMTSLQAESIELKD